MLTEEEQEDLFEEFDVDRELPSSLMVDGPLINMSEMTLPTSCVINDIELEKRLESEYGAKRGMDWVPNTIDDDEEKERSEIIKPTEGALLVGYDQEGIKREVKRMEELMREGFMSKEEMQRRMTQMNGTSTDQWWKSDVQELMTPPKPQSQANELPEPSSSTYSSSSMSTTMSPTIHVCEEKEFGIVGEVMSVVGMSKEELKREVEELEELHEAGFVCDEEYHRRKEMLNSQAQSAPSLKIQITTPKETTDSHEAEQESSSSSTTGNARNEEEPQQKTKKSKWKKQKKFKHKEEEEEEEESTSTAQDDNGYSLFD